MKKERRKNTGRRVTDIKHDNVDNLPHTKKEADMIAYNQKGTMQKIVWEGAKGELNGLIAICHSPPVTKHCKLLEIKTSDLILGMDAAVYKWGKQSDKK